MQVLVVNTSTRWVAAHPRFGDVELIASLIGDGHLAHDVPIPFDPGSSDNASALSLLPFDMWGDVMLGLGHRAAFIRHPRKIVVVDDDLISAHVTRSILGRNLSVALTESHIVVCLNRRVQEYVSHRWHVPTRLVSAPSDLIEIIGRLEP